MHPTHRLVLSTIVVHDYDEAIRFYVDKIGFTLAEDTALEEGKRWVVVVPTSSDQSGILLARANDAVQKARVGNQTGGRVSFFLSTTDFKESYKLLLGRGVRFCEQPRQEPYGTVAVFLDLYDNRWDLIQPNSE
jgi:catechol 2,3-dioxygenase-like lactoylglutathione lyase family enzyme